MTFFRSSRLNIYSVVACLNEKRKVGLHTYNNCKSLLPIYWIYHLLLKVSSSFHIHFHSLLLVLYCPCNKIIPLSIVCIFAKILTTSQTCFCRLYDKLKNVIFLWEIIQLIIYTLNIDKMNKKYHYETKKNSQTALYYLNIFLYFAFFE